MIRSLLAASVGTVALVAWLIVGAPESHSAPSTGPDVVHVGEDSPSWDCRTMGNATCGPDNVQHVAAGCYDDGGDLVAAWPCAWRTLPNGYRVLFTSDGESDLYNPTPDDVDNALYRAGYTN